jgi:diguanylate cyclase (GGDEF)-like protein
MKQRSRRQAPRAHQTAAFAREVQTLRFCDSVTLLPNRKKFDELFVARLAVRGAEPLAFLIVDLTRFREVNFALSHAVGDDLLRLVATRISAVLGEHDVVARVGTRFPVLLRHADGVRAKAWADALCVALEAPFHIGAIACEIGARIGIALCPDDDCTYSGLLRKADIAVEQALHSGQAVACYNAAVDRHTPERLDLIGQFRHAVKSGQIRLYCQPKIAMRSLRVIGVEVLARWVHPERGLIPPDDFVPMIEDTELIHVLTNHMLREAAQCALVWQAQDIAVPLAVNLSTQDLATPALGRFLGELLASTGIDRSLLELEVTERSLLKNPATGIAELERLHAMGFRLSIDDFGTGFSSLNYLTRMPVDVLKIDHSFTMQMVGDKRSAAIVRSTIHMAHDLGMAVVAEGTADQAIWDALAELDCDEAQGYFIARPMPVEDFSAWLTAAGAAYSLAPRHA